MEFLIYGWNASVDLLKKIHNSGIMKKLGNTDISLGMFNGIINFQEEYDSNTEDDGEDNADFANEKDLDTISKSNGQLRKSTRASKCQYWKNRSRRMIRM